MANAPAVQALMQQAFACHQKGDLQNAERGYRQVLQFAPDQADALRLLADIAYQTGHLDPALDLLAKAAKNAPKNAEIPLRQGIVLTDLGRYRDAVAAFKKAIKNKPDYAVAYGNLATAYKAQGRFNEAVRAFRAGLEVEPGNTKLAYELATLLLTIGQFEEGWALYDRRFDGPAPVAQRRPFSGAAWQGEDLTGKSIVVWGEQGIGDEILYASMIPDLIALDPARLLIECAPRLVPLFARSFPTAEVFARTDPPRQVSTDYQCAIGSLGRVLRPTRESFSAGAAPYLTADPDRTAALRAAYQARFPGKKLVGLSWKSAAKNYGREKSASLLDWKDLLVCPDFAFINVQYGDVSAELAAVKDRLGIEIYDNPDVDPLKDMDSAAAELAALDELQATSNTAVHLGGALGVRTQLTMPEGLARLWYWQRVDAGSSLIYRNVEFREK